ncbi:uncharacterized protein [Henckelia pumila]|uniref:uncharacterized protein n=1 Tax=Henckelia pumila TaxID=405737 RepID=UPI003C6E556A
MGKAKKTPKFAVMKKIISHKAIKHYKEEVLNPNKKDLSKEKLPRNVPQVSSALFFKHNTALGPPYRVLVDTNFINFSIQNKLDLEKGMMDCLYAKCTPCITDCVMAELEKLGQKYRVALRYVLHFPIKEKGAEFSNLQQVQLNIEEYVAKFTSLLNFSPHIADNDEAQADHFINGLNPDVFTLVNAGRPNNFANALNRAKGAEVGIMRQRGAQFVPPPAKPSQDQPHIPPPPPRFEG